jgi:hypothetical protein
MSVPPPCLIPSSASNRGSCPYINQCPVVHSPGCILEKSKHPIAEVVLWKNDEVKIIFMHPDADQKNGIWEGSAKELYIHLHPFEGQFKGWR